jgi:protoporphyrin/coproporphyrin ferrochelatase
VVRHVPYDAVIVVSFGGPEGPDQVMPFLENVVAGRNVPRARLERVAEQYYRFGGVSPINGINRALVAALRLELSSAGIDLPVYWGNRHWAPFLADEVGAMAADGVRRALAFVTSAYASYSGCRQYLDDIDRARTSVGPRAPAIDKIRVFYDHPEFLSLWVDSVRAARGAAGEGGTAGPVLFSAHSIPRSMAATSDYQAQLAATAGYVATRAGLAPDEWRQVWQSRSGPPGQPWLEPDILEVIDALPAGDAPVVVAPIGFLADHMEVVYDLDTQAAAAAHAKGRELIRAATPGVHPRFLRMIRLLVAERLAAPQLVGTTCPAGHRPAPGC